MRNILIITLTILLIHVNTSTCKAQSLTIGGSLGFGAIKSHGRISAKSDPDYGDDAADITDFGDLEDDEEDINIEKPIYDIKDAPKLFKKFIKDFHKVYKDEEDYQTHYKNFVKNLKEINNDNSNKEFSSTSDINLFSDLSLEERFSFLGGIPPL